MSTSKPRRRTVFLLLVVGTVVATVMAAAVPTYSLNTRRTGARDDRGFPLYYTDDRGQALRLCEDGSAHCIRAVPEDLAAPDGEALYWSASTTLHSKRGPIDVEFALEAAFGDAGRPVVFDRIRVRGHLNQKGRYILLHPYGRMRFRAITPREQRNVDVTHDRNCSVARKGPLPRQHRQLPPGHQAPEGLHRLRSEEDPREGRHGAELPGAADSQGQVHRQDGQVPRGRQEGGSPRALTGSWPSRAQDPRDVIRSGGYRPHFV
jgi:hypothetical protein